MAKDRTTEIRLVRVYGAQTFYQCVYENGMWIPEGPPILMSIRDDEPVTVMVERLCDCMRACRLPTITAKAVRATKSMGDGIDASGLRSAVQP